MKKTALVVGLLVVLSFTASAQEFSTEAFDQETLELYQEEFNEANEKLPGFLGALLGNQRVNIVIHSNDSEDLEIGMVMDGTKISEIENETVANSTLEIETYDETIEAIYHSEDPPETVRQKMQEGKIRYEASGFLNRVQVFFVDIWAGL